jgi:hypothetical protein
MSMKEQSRKLVDLLDSIVESIDDWERIVPVLRELNIPCGLRGEGTAP